MTIQLQPVAHALELKCQNQTMTMTADRVLHCIKSFVALINGGPFCINNRPVLLTVSLSVGPRLICRTLLRRPLETSKTVEGILCLLLRLLLRLSLLCPCCSLQIYICMFKNLLKYLHHTHTISVWNWQPSCSMLLYAEYCTEHSPVHNCCCLTC